MYQGLRTNLPREIMSFLDFPFDHAFLGRYSQDPRRFPTHMEVRNSLPGLLLGNLVHARIIRMPVIICGSASICHVTTTTTTHTHLA